MLRDDQIIDNIPWRVLIRIRYVADRDVLVAGIVQRSLSALLPAPLAATFATQITASAMQMARAPVQELPAEEGLRWRQRQLERLAEYDDICPPILRPPLPHPVPGWWASVLETHGPRPEPWRESGIAEAASVLTAAVRLVDQLSEDGVPGSLSLLSSVLGTTMDSLAALA
jgi:hypothetical protein